AISWAYVRYGKLPQTEAILYGVKPVVMAIVAQALLALGRSAVKSRLLALVGFAVVMLNFAGLNELILLFAAGAFVCVVGGLAQSFTKRPLQGLWLFPTMNSVVAAATPAAPSVGLWSLFGFFVKVGSVLFGSGYVLLAFLRADLVERWHWLTESQLI